MELQELADAFRRYAVHKPKCNLQAATATGCPCGFIQLLLRLPANGNEPMANISEEPAPTEGCTRTDGAS